MDGMDVAVSQKNWSKTHETDGRNSTKLLTGKGIRMTELQLSI